MKRSDLPSLIEVDRDNCDSKSHRSGSHETELAVRLEAFLSLKSANTQRTYRGIIDEWCRFLTDHFPGMSSASLFLQATDLHATAYKSWLEKQPGQSPRLKKAQTSGKNHLPSTASKSSEKRDGMQHTLSNATIAKKFAALRRIYRMLKAYELGVGHNPFDTDRVPPPPAKAGQKRPTEMIDFSLVKEILQMPDATHPKGLRDTAVLAVLFGAGLRRSEVVNIRIGDVRTTSSGTTYLYLRSTKARTDARQALPEWAAQAVRKLIVERKSQHAGEGDYLFVSFRGKGGLFPTALPLSSSGLYKLFQRYCSLAGVSEKVSPHSARATAITKLLSDGVSHREVQEFSRHSSVQMVETYDKRRLGVDENPATILDYDDS